MKRSAYIKRMTYLKAMLAKYAHRWGEEPSQRMFDWVDEYTELKSSPLWSEYCESTGLSTSHDAYDLMA